MPSERLYNQVEAMLKHYKVPVFLRVRVTEATSSHGHGQLHIFGRLRLKRCKLYQVLPFGPTVSPVCKKTRRSERTRVWPG
ncbi:unnamed protein product [Ectocarpus fasciculatus]